MSDFTRRALISSGLAAGSAALGLRVARAWAGSDELSLTPSPARYTLTGGVPTERMMSYGRDAAPPLLRLRQGVPARITVTNRLDEVTTVHWHGVRVPVGQDGVPWLTQQPIAPDESFTYEFTPPDAGTFWYHPHCNTLEQIARGLAGVLIVDEAEPPAFDADIALLVRDFRLGGDGQFIDFYKPRNMARGGTLGTVSTVNWAVDPVVGAPAGAIVRLRLAVTDTARIYELGLEGAEAAVIALDGQPTPAPMPLSGLMRVAPGQRADLAVLMPAAGEAALFMVLPNGAKRRLARLAARGTPLGRRIEDIPALAPNPAPVPDVARAQSLDFVFGWSPEGKATGAGGCGYVPYRFWSINRQAYAGDAPADAANPSAPLATLAMGRDYVLRLRNETQNDHPIHLHGLAMHPLDAAGRLTGQARDTVLLGSRQEALVAIRADSPGDWVFHCHVIEHQKSGLSGILRVV